MILLYETTTTSTKTTNTKTSATTTTKTFNRQVVHLFLILIISIIICLDSTKFASAFCIHSITTSSSSSSSFSFETSRNSKSNNNIKGQSFKHQSLTNSLLYAQQQQQDQDQDTSTNMSSTTTTTPTINNDNDNDNDNEPWTPGNPFHEQQAREELGIWPLDDANAILLNQVHPRNYISPALKAKTSTDNDNDNDADNNNNSNTIPCYDLVAIGSGAGGLVSSKQSARRGAKSAMISEHLAGGDCLNVGCVPSKALLRSAKAVAQVRKAITELGVIIGDTNYNNGNNKPNVSVDFPTVMKRLRTLRATIAPADGHEGTEQAGARVYQGRGRLIGPNTIQVTNNVSKDGKETATATTIQFKTCVLATGGRPAVPKNIPGLQDAPYTTNEKLFNLETLPPRMIIIGAGVIALEMAQTFALFGSKVTVLSRSSRLFESKKGDIEAATILQKELEECGVSFLWNTSIEKVETLKTGNISTTTTVSNNNGDGDDSNNSSSGDNNNNDASSLPLMKVYVTNDSTASTSVPLECECLLIATGRLANVEDLGLEAAGVEYQPGSGIRINDLGQTIGNPSIYAVGDCVANVPRLTHMSGEMAKLVVQNALAGDDWKVSSLVVPSVMYTEPEYATVGIITSEEQAKDQNIEIDVYRTGLEHLDRALLESNNVGFCKIFVKKNTDEILGATIVAERAGEMINEVSLAMKNKLGLYAIGRNIHSYPTMGEAVQFCGIQYINKHLPRFD